MVSVQFGKNRHPVILGLLNRKTLDYLHGTFLDDPSPSNELPVEGWGFYLSDCFWFGTRLLA